MEFLDMSLWLIIKLGEKGESVIQGKHLQSCFETSQQLHAKYL